MVSGNRNVEGLSWAMNNVISLLCKIVSLIFARRVSFG